MLLNERSKLVIADGSVFRNLKIDIVRTHQIALPSFEEQGKIAQILGALDDKIELNNQINQNLETIGQTLFKHWFVNYEFPNEYGLPYNSSGSEMVDSELGEFQRIGILEIWDKLLIILIQREFLYLKKKETLEREFILITVLHL